MHYLSQTNRPAREQGFTLIEVLVIAPIILLVIGGFIALMMTMVGDVLRTRDQSSMMHDIQDTLSRIEEDTRLSTQFLATSGTLPSPQGTNNNFQGTAAFTSSDSLILSTLATDKNPVDSTRQLIYYAMQPNACGANQSANRLFSMKIIYFIKDGSLWRRSIVPPNNMNGTVDINTTCAAPWQQNSCSPGYATGGVCQTKDVEMLRNVSSLTVVYYTAAGDTTPTGSSNAPAATTIETTLSTSKTIAGRSITASESVRANKLNTLSNP